MGSQRAGSMLHVCVHKINPLLFGSLFCCFFSASQALDLSHNSFAAVPALDSVPDVMLLRIANNNIKIVTKLELLTKLLVRV